MQDVTPRVVDKYIQTLQNTPPVSTKTHRAKSEFMSNQNIEKIIKLLRCAFKQAVRWELVSKNPFDNVVLPKVEYKKRDTTLNLEVLVEQLRKPPELANTLAALLATAPSGK